MKKCSSLFKVGSNGLRLGMMLAVQYVIGQLNAPVNEFIAFTRDWQDAKISLELIGEIHSLKNEEVSQDDFQKVFVLPESKTVIIENLSFQYERPHAPKNQLHLEN